MSVEKKNEKIDVTIDTKRTEELARENERLKMQLEKGETVETGEVHDLDERKIKFYQDFEDPRILECKSSEELHELMNAIIKTGYENAKPKPTGEVSLNAQQLGTQSTGIRNQKFNSMEDLIKTLREVASDSTNPEQEDAKLALKQLWTKTIAGLKSGDLSKANLSVNPNPGTPENESDQPLQVNNPSQLKIGRSEVGESLDRANQVARAKQRVASERFFAEQQKSIEQERSKKDAEARKVQVNEA
jgi:hypothetical protein